MTFKFDWTLKKCEVGMRRRQAGGWSLEAGRSRQRLLKRSYWKGCFASFSNHWKTFRRYFPIIGNIGNVFSNASRRCSAKADRRILHDGTVHALYSYALRALRSQRFNPFRSLNYRNDTLSLFLAAPSCLPRPLN